MTASDRADRDVALRWLAHHVGGFGMLTPGGQGLAATLRCLMPELTPRQRARLWIAAYDDVAAAAARGPAWYEEFMRGRG